MNDRVSSLRLVCQIITPWETAEKRQTLEDQIRSGSVKWEHVLEIASRCFVVTALWAGFVRKGLTELLPPDFCEALRELHRLNSRRNLSIRTQAEEIIHLLNQVGVEPLLLKGIAHLFGNLFPDPGARIMTDVDLLIPSNFIEVSLPALESHGYGVAPDEQGDHQVWHHLPPLLGPSSVASLEIHTELASPIDPPVLTAEGVWEAATRATTDGLTYRVLSPADDVLYNIFHTEIHHLGYHRGIIPVKGLTDFAYVMLREEARVDWERIRSALADHGLERMLRSYLLMATELFGCPVVPELFPRFSSRVHFQRCLFRRRSDSFWKMDNFRWKLSHLFSARRMQRRFGAERTLLSLTKWRVRYGAHLAAKYLFGARRSMLSELMFDREEEEKDHL